MERQGLIDKVKIKLDEYTPDGVALPFDDYIGPMLDESAKEVLEKAPIHLLTPSVLPVAGMTYDTNKAYILVPEDYIRLHEIRFPLWKKTITAPLTMENPEHQIQENEYLAPGYARPRVVLRHTTISGTVKRVLECAKVLSGAAPSLTSYIKLLKPEEMPDNLSESISWLCASKILLIGGRPNEAKAAYEQYVNTI